MMEKLFLFTALMISTCCAVTQDLSGKVFVFPKETNTDHVKLLTTRSTFYNVTVCLRFLTDLNRAYSLFSMSTPTVENAFLIYGEPANHVLHVYSGSGPTFHAVPFPQNTWHSLCSTWGHGSGVAQIWLNGKPYVKKFVTNQPIGGKPISILGQEQDSYGGGFDAAQSFVGMISDVHMWDQVLTPTEIKSYMNHRHVTPGNVFNWRSLQYEITGLVLVDDAPDDM
uniref:Pentraxin family member n=1 Tax=Cynoglossus semilaevis TaxID=244447 RepID=A0A1B0YCI3_CYNSE|nr:serum amyloid P component [Cynoglossus semilaevis]